jgi:hypothetical protein
MPRDKQQDPDQQFSERETAKRRDEWLRRSLSSPPKQHSQIVAERKTKRGGKAKGEKK